MSIFLVCTGPTLSWSVSIYRSIHSISLHCCVALSSYCCKKVRGEWEVICRHKVVWDLSPYYEQGWQMKASFLTWFKETVEPAHTFCFYQLQEYNSRACLQYSWPLLAGTFEINYDLFWHNRNPLHGASQIVALGMFRHERSSSRSHEHLALSLCSDIFTGNVQNV